MCPRISGFSVAAANPKKIENTTSASMPSSAAAFTAAHPEFEAGSVQTLWPQDLNANGMFIATWRRKK